MALFKIIFTEIALAADPIVPDIPLLDGNIINILVSLLLFAIGISGIIAFIYIIVGGYKYITSSGSPESTESAKKTLMYSIIGLIIVIASFAIVRFVVLVPTTPPDSLPINASSSNPNTSSSATNQNDEDKFGFPNLNGGIYKGVDISDNQITTWKQQPVSSDIQNKIPGIQDI